MHLCDRYAVAFCLPWGAIARICTAADNICVDLYPNRYLHKRERLGTWVLSLAPGRFLNFFRYFHAALEGEYHGLLMYRHMIYCGKPEIFIKGNRHRLRMFHGGNECADSILLFLSPLPFRF